MKRNHVLAIAKVSAVAARNVTVPNLAAMVCQLHLVGRNVGRARRAVSLWTRLAGRGRTSPARSARVARERARLLRLQHEASSLATALGLAVRFPARCWPIAVAATGAAPSLGDGRMRLGGL